MSSGARRGGGLPPDALLGRELPCTSDSMRCTSACTDMGVMGWPSGTEEARSRSPDAAGLALSCNSWLWSELACWGCLSLKELLCLLLRAGGLSVCPPGTAAWGGWTVCSALSAEGLLERGKPCTSPMRCSSWCMEVGVMGSSAASGPSPEGRRTLLSCCSRSAVDSGSSPRCSGAVWEG